MCVYMYVYKYHGHLQNYYTLLYIYTRSFRFLKQFLIFHKCQGTRILALLAGFRWGRNGERPRLMLVLIILVNIYIPVNRNKRRYWLYELF